MLLLLQMLLLLLLAPRMLFLVVATGPVAATAGGPDLPWRGVRWCLQTRSGGSWMAPLHA